MNTIRFNKNNALTNNFIFLSCSIIVNNKKYLIILIRIYIYYMLIHTFIVKKCIFFHLHSVISPKVR